MRSVPRRRRDISRRKVQALAATLLPGVLPPPGWSQTSGRLTIKAIKAQPLETLGGEASVALGIDEAGHAVGASFTPAGLARGFLWTPAVGTVDLPQTRSRTTLTG
jgi:hypothetical protein